MLGCEFPQDWSRSRGWLKRSLMMVIEVSIEGEIVESPDLVKNLSAPIVFVLVYTTLWGPFLGTGCTSTLQRVESS